MTDYLHALDGRMRIKIKAVKGSAAAAAEITRYLCSCYGIDEVNANAVTGNVLILYNSRRISQEGIIDRLEEAGHLKKAAPAHAGGGDGIVGVLARAVMETALQSMVMALI
jgi:hypothetical protein